MASDALGGREGQAGGSSLPGTILREQLCFLHLTGAIRFQAAGVGKGALRSFWVPSASGRPLRQARLLLVLPLASLPWVVPAAARGPHSA